MRQIVTLAAGLFTASTLALTASAQTVTNVIDAFNPSGVEGYSYSAGLITTIWTNWFGGAFTSLSWDGTSDANGNPNSGSMKIMANFNGSGSNPNQFEVYDGLAGITPPVNGLQYTNFQCDVRFDPSSATATNGGVTNFGELQFGTTTAGYNQDYFGGIAIPSGNTNWVHVSIPINATSDANLKSIQSLLIHIYGPYFSSPGLSGTTTLWIDNIKFVGSAEVPTNCVVDWNNTHQRIDGFGASSAFDGSWTTAQADMFFSTNTGIGLSLLRSRIAPDGTTIESNIMQMAQARGARVWSTPWSPPAAFKDSGNVNGGNFVSSNYQAYASQLANYVLFVKTNLGINLYAISVQNEPDQSTTYESCLWTDQQFHDFLPYLYNALSNNGVTSTKIMIAEHSSWTLAPTSIAMGDPVTSNLVGTLASHDYDFSASPENTGNLPLWETEVSSFDAFDGSIGNGLYWATQIHSCLTYAQVNAWHFWWLAPFATDNESLVDTNGNPTKRMYVLGNYSRFVRPGFYRIDVSNSASTYISAYKDPGSGKFAIVAINPSPTDFVQTFNLAGFNTPNVTPWITSGSLSLSNQLSVNVTNETFVYDLPASSVVTFVGQAIPGTPTIGVHLAGTRPALTLNGPTGWNYTLWSSPDLTHWQSLLVTNPPATPITWTDPGPIATNRYYRVSLGQ